jgi:Na+/H+ antiporter NhaD/arsenite permease-like protein
MRAAHKAEHAHRKRLEAEGKHAPPPGVKPEVSLKAEVLHLLGEVEAIFGIWVLPLLVALSLRKNWGTARDYVASVNYTEPVFVVIIMSIAASRPILKLSERIMAMVASVGKGTPGAWWFSVLTIGPLLGSFITEPAAMTICAMLLADKIYRYRPTKPFAYATLGLLFVNVSIGGTLTHFAAPPVLMVAGKWGWGFSHMLQHFGLAALTGITISNLIYYFSFRTELKRLAEAVPSDPLELERDAHDPPVPVWITAVHILCLIWTVYNNHYPVLFIGGFLFYIAFTRATEHHQAELALRPAMLVGFFLAGLVVHGGLQGWWIAPVLSRLTEIPLFFGAVGLTAFNDNAAITYLASLVPNFTPELQHAVVAGAVAGGGLTVIANAPNPAGQSILGRFFPGGVSPLYLFLGAAIPTAVVCGAFMVIK